MDERFDRLINAIYAPRRPGRIAGIRAAFEAWQANTMPVAHPCIVPMLIGGIMGAGWGIFLTWLVIA